MALCYNLIDQLKLWEPAVIASETKITRGLDYTDEMNSQGVTTVNPNKLSITVTLTTTYMQTISFNITNADLAGIV